MNSKSTYKVIEWIDKEKVAGLVDIKFDKVKETKSTVESFSSEVIQALEAPSLPDRSFF